MSIHPVSPRHPKISQPKNPSMKTLFSSLFVLIATGAFADVAVYNGAQVSKTISLAGTQTVAEKFIEVVDLTNSQVVVVKLSTPRNSPKTFSVSPAATVVKTEVQ